MGEHCSCDTGLPDRLKNTRLLSAVLILLGSVSIVCGVPTLVLVAAEPSVPYITGSALWSGVLVITAGILGVLAAREGLQQRSLKFKWLAVALQSTSILAASITVIHLGLSLWGLVTCLTAPDPGPLSSAQCNVNTAGNIVQAIYGILIAMAMMTCSVITIIHISRIVNIYKTPEEEMTVFKV